MLTGITAGGELGAEDGLLVQAMVRLSAREREAIVTMVTILAGNMQGVEALHPAAGAATLHAARQDYRGQDGD